jgi:hypothetical protein
MNQPDKPQSSHVDDDRLLADAIPIDPAELEELDDDEEEGDGAIPLEPEFVGPSQVVREMAKAEKPVTDEAWAEELASRADAVGAKRVKTFITKLKQDLNDPLHGAPHCLQEIDRQINDWLEAHPDVTVKFATMVTGEMMSKKGADSALIMSVWV